MAARLVWVTRRRGAWLLISLAITLMMLRRVVSLVMVMSGATIVTPAYSFELVGLLTSILLLAGIYLIRPMFTAIVRSEEELRAMNEKLAALAREQARDITRRIELEQERERLIAELQEALSGIRTLKGMLPICSSCKKIRDDKGYWNQIEAYVSEHTEAEFTHGICPECAKKLYPKHYKDR
jgi:membrane protein implicated in regulation of membrane protease activity